MAYYLVRARLKEELRPELRARLDSGEITKMRPFGTALFHGLDNARLDAEGWAVWEEEDYCRPPLAMERRAVLDDYFTELSVEAVAAEEGWQQIENLPKLWHSEVPGST